MMKNQKNIKTLAVCNFKALCAQGHVVPLWKAQICGCLDADGHGRGSFFRVCHAFLKNAISYRKKDEATC